MYVITQPLHKRSKTDTLLRTILSQNLQSMLPEKGSLFLGVRAAVTLWFDLLTKKC